MRTGADEGASERNGDTQYGQMVTDEGTREEEREKSKDGPVPRVESVSPGTKGRRTTEGEASQAVRDRGGVLPLGGVSQGHTWRVLAGGIGGMW